MRNQDQEAARAEYAQAVAELAELQARREWEWSEGRGPRCEEEDPEYQRLHEQAWDAWDRMHILDQVRDVVKGGEQ